jgi:hypothetical protein
MIRARKTGGRTEGAGRFDKGEDLSFQNKIDLRFL